MPDWQLIVPLLQSWLDQLAVLLSRVPQGIELAAILLPVALAIFSRQMVAVLGSILLAVIAFCALVAPSNMAVTLASGANLGSLIIALAGIVARRKGGALEAIRAEFASLRKDVKRLSAAERRRVLIELRSSPKGELSAASGGPERATSRTTRVITFGGAWPGDTCFADIVAVDGEIIGLLQGSAPVSFSNQQLKVIIAATSSLPVEARDGFLRAIAASLSAVPSDDDARRSISVGSGRASGRLSRHLQRRILLGTQGNSACFGITNRIASGPISTRRERTDQLAGGVMAVRPAPSSLSWPERSLNLEVCGWPTKTGTGRSENC